MNEVCTFSTVEDFWRYYNNIPRPSEIFYDGETRKKVGPEKKTIVEWNEMELELVVIEKVGSGDCQARKRIRYLCFSKSSAKEEI